MNAASTSRAPTSLQDAIQSGHLPNVDRTLEDKKLVPQISDLESAISNWRKSKHLGRRHLRIILSVCSAFATRTEPAFARRVLEELFDNVNFDQTLPESNRTMAAARVRTAIRRIPIASSTQTRPMRQYKSPPTRPNFYNPVDLSVRKNRIREAFQGRLKT